MRVRIEPRTLRQILRLLLTTNMSAGDIAHVVGVSRNSIRRIQEHLESVPTQTDPQEIDGWSDEQLFSRLQLAPFNSFFLKPHPDWNWVQKEMRERSVTLELLWREWRETEPAGICYSQFTALYAKFVKQLPIVMRQVHIPGEKLFVDFSGKTVPIYLEGLQEPRQAQIFVGVLGYSSYTFACAVWTQKIEDWVRCHARALTFFGGVPKYLVPDNLKAAVVKHGKDDVQIGLTYQQLAHHYKTIIFPARPRKPKDKAKAEAGVKLVQRWMLASLRHQRFFSLAELNAALNNLIPEFNRRLFKGKSESRQSLFQTTERAALQPLPSEPFEDANWRFGVTVRRDYLVPFDNHHYSVPARLINQQVDLRATEDLVEFFQNHLRVCSHPRKFVPGISVIPEHRPPNHRIYAESEPDELLSWAETVGPAVLRHIEFHLNKRSDVANGRKAASALRKAAREHGETRLEAACAYALTLNTFALKSIRSILREEPDKRPASTETRTRSLDHENLRGAKYFADDEVSSPC